MVIKQAGRNEEGITLDRDSVWQEFFKAIGTDDENREVPQSITSALELIYWRNTGDSHDSDAGGDNTRGSRRDVEGGGTDARVSSILARSFMLESDCTYLNQSENLDMKNILNLSNFFGINL